jgi:hypothetical protein
VARPGAQVGDQDGGREMGVAFDLVRVHGVGVVAVERRPVAPACTPGV